MIVVCGLWFVAGCQQEQPDHTQMRAGILQGPVVSGQSGTYESPPKPVPGAGQKGPGAVKVDPKGQAGQQYLPPGHMAAGVPKSWWPAVRPHAWKWIMVHHSDTQVGSAASFDRYHREVHHWKELGYDFVIGNGHGAADGLVEVGPRWTKQETGAHAGVLEYNEYGIGICLVGDFQTGRPTQAQLRSLAKLNAFLMRAYRIPASRVIGHRDAKKTNCPGKNLSMAMVRTMATQVALGEGSVLGEALAMMEEGVGGK